MDEKHTPTPWINEGIPVGADETEIGTAFIVAADLGGLVAAALPWPTELDSGDFSRVEANASFIVKVANAHDDLIAALTYIASAPQLTWMERAQIYEETARSALAKVGAL